MAIWRGWRRSRKTAQAAANDHGKHSLMGRLFLRDVPYVLPKDLGEVNRLDFQHYMMRSALHGNYAAPIGRPDSILDVGSGTGRWAIEMAALFPHARVVGMDVAEPQADTPSPRPVTRPDNYSFVTGNILEGLSFPNDSFAFVHQRYMIGAIPRDQWPRTVAELVRVTKPGGWIELVEAGTSRGGAAALAAVDEWVASVLAVRGLDIHLAPHLRGFLEEAGARDVVVREVGLPLGAYGGRIGTLVESDYFAAVNAMRGPVVSLGIASESDYERTAQAAREEVQRGRCVFPVYVVYGRKP
ncbi:MAG TPA: methyltransferase domain-containing protein [Ktedonobacterales bacterium]|nr:methyltransferase domain-containing protein [Ktedonobacterales bacterium]